MISRPRSVSSILRFLQVFLKSVDDFPLVNKIYEEAFGNHKPSRSTVEVSRLPKDVLVEIECIARCALSHRSIEIMLTAS